MEVPAAAQVPPSGPYGNRDQLLEIWSEKVPGRGEDALPIACATGPSSGAVAVFDGLGGAGAALVTTDVGEQSHARVAATLARTVTAQFLQAARPLPDGDTAAAQLLAAMLRDAFAGYVEEHGLGKGRLRSRLIRTLPTTLALGRYGSGVSGLMCEAIWAGDSRVYLLTPESGLQQLSDDDLRSGADALDNLHLDSPLSNLVSASVPFTINTRTVRVSSTYPILFAATDGCFGYLPTPWHFEFLLLDSLQQADSFEDWKHRIDVGIATVTGDDVSLALVAITDEPFTTIRSSFAVRAGEVAGSVRQVDLLARRLQAVRDELSQLQATNQRVRVELWRAYRQRYEHWLANAPRRTSDAQHAAEWTPDSGAKLAAVAGADEPEPHPSAGPRTPGHTCPHCGHLVTAEEGPS
jgi:hypothetical protein